MTDKVQDLLKRSEDFITSHEIEMNYLEEFEKFTSSILKHTRPILIEYNTTFHFERKGNKREGALTQKDIKSDITINGRPLMSKVVKIRRDVDFSLQIHTYFHELTHIISNHDDERKNDKALTHPQKEYVAETAAQALIYTFCGGLEAKDLPSNGKWDHSTYISSWIHNSRFSDETIDTMWKQINYSYDLISKTILNKINDNNLL